MTWRHSFSHKRVDRCAHAGQLASIMGVDPSRTLHEPKHTSEITRRDRCAFHITLLCLYTRPIHARLLPEDETQVELAKLRRESELEDERQHPSIAQIPRFYTPKRTGVHGPAQELQQGVAKIVRARLQERMASMLLDASELNSLWRLLKQHASPPHGSGKSAPSS